MRFRGFIKIMTVAGLVSGLTAVGPASAFAQGGVALGLWGGVFSPLGSDIDLGGVGGQVERNNSFAGGARLTFWGGNILGLEAVAGLSPAKVNVAGATVNGTRNLDVFAGGLKLMLGVSPGASPVGFHIGAGPALIRRSHDVLDESESVTDLGGVIGAGLRFSVSPGLGLRFDAEDYMYNSDFGGNEETRNDLVLSAGLSIQL